MIEANGPHIEAFWKNACDAMGIPRDTPYWASAFSETNDDPYDEIIVDAIGALALYGYKRGTCHQKEQFSRDGIPERKIGDYWLITNCAGEAVCVVRITDVQVMPFKDVPETFALSEGEGDYEFWYRGHEQYFKEQCERWGSEFSSDTLAVCESFERVYRPDVDS